MEKMRISFPKLNNLKPTLESTALKLMEEMGELSQAIGKYRGLSGEEESLEQDTVVGIITRELLDVAQTAVTMMYVLEEKYNVDLGTAMQEHIEKLFRKKYIIPEQKTAKPEEI